MASTERLLSTKSANIGSTWHDLAQPRLNVGSGEAQMGAKMGQHGPKMAPLGRRWSPEGPNMAQGGASEGPTCPQQGRKIVKHASALLIFSLMSQNVVFPTVLHGSWCPAAPKMSQDGLQESLRWPKRAARWGQESQVGAKMSPK